jgi:hypothetical protein
LKERSKKLNENILPQDPLERCHLRWHSLFRGVWKAVCKHDENLRFGLLEALKQYGFDLLKGSVPENNPFKANPSDEVLRNAISFEKGATIPNLRGRKPPWKRLNPFLSLTAYSYTLWMLKDLPKYKGARCKWLKEHLYEILSPIQPTARQEISDDDLKSLVVGEKKKVALNVTAYLCNMEPEAFRMYLKEARRQFPEIAKASKHGTHLVRSQRTPVK